MLPVDASLEEVFANNPYFSPTFTGRHASVSIATTRLETEEANPTLVFGPTADQDADECIHLTARQPSFASIRRLVLKGGCSLDKLEPNVRSLPNIILPISV